MKYTLHLLYGIGFLLFTAMIASSCNTKSEKPTKTSFHFNLPTDTTFRYIIKNKQEVSSNGAHMNLSTTIEVLYQKQKDSADLQVVQSTIDRVAVQIQSPSMNVSFDSRDGNVPQSSQSAIEPMFRLVNQTYLIYLDRGGAIRDVKLLSGNAASASNDSLLIKTLSKSFDFYPEHEVSIGGSWKTNTELPVQGINTTLETTYTLKGISGDTALLDVHSKLEARERKLVMNGISMDIKMKGTQEGNMKVLISKGRLLHAGFSSKITGNFSASGQKMESLTEGTSSITSEKE